MDAHGRHRNRGDRRIETGRSTGILLLLAGLLLPPVACAGAPPRAADPPSSSDAQYTELELQAVVMAMADDYIAGLAEATYLTAAAARENPRARWLLQSFLRNGVGASLDIASGPNPNTALFDMLILASLQAWAFENHWIDAAGLDAEVGGRTVARLREAEHRAWQSAATVLREEQRNTLRGLIGEWIEQNPDRTVVSLVRFSEFSDARRADPEQQQRARGLLVDFSEVTETVDKARLLGERLLWLANRYPYVIGEQSELTLYRIADQPEVREALAALGTFQATGDSVSGFLDGLPAELDRQRDALVRQAQQVRSDSILQAREELAGLLEESVDGAFRRFREESQWMFTELDTRHEALDGTLAEVQNTVEASTVLSGELTETALAVDRLLQRFAPEAGEEEPALRMTDIRDAASEAARTAERLTVLVERANDILLSEEWGSRVEDLDALATQRIDQIFWRGLVLVLVLLAGLALLRLLPRRPPSPGHG